MSSTPRTSIARTAAVLFTVVVIIGGCSSDSKKPGSSSGSSSASSGPSKTCAETMHDLANFGVLATDDAKTASLNACENKDDWIAEATKLRVGGTNLLGTTASEADLLTSLCAGHDDAPACK